MNALSFSRIDPGAIEMRGNITQKTVLYKSGGSSGTKQVYRSRAVH
jgi:hypothetical protein